MKSSSFCQNADGARSPPAVPNSSSRSVVRLASAASSTAPASMAKIMSTAQSANIHPDVLERDAQRQRRRLERMQVMQVERTSRWWEDAHSPNVRVISRPSHFKAYTEAILRPVSQPAVMHFFRPDCPGCKRMYPKMMQIVSQYPAVDFFKVHAGKLQEECQEMDVDRMPYFRLYLRGELVAEFSANLASINDVRRAMESLKRGEEKAAAAGAAPAVSALSAAEALSMDGGGLDSVDALTSIDAAELDAAAAVGDTIDTMVLDGVGAIAGGTGSHPLGLPTHLN
eukprot:jgi/Ulvmu1/10784/UM069_0018.1